MHDNPGMVTQRLRVDAANMAGEESQYALDTAATLLRSGGTVAMPTETVYGLGANALDAAAVAKVFRAKERPGWDPLIVHVSDEAMLRELVTAVPERAAQLMEVFWPGPLTVLLEKTQMVPDVVTAGRPLVGVRMPAHPVARELIRRAGVPVAAPSANRFGRTSPTTAEHVLEDLDGRIDAVVDAGPTSLGVESTVVDATIWPMVVYRPGTVTLEQIRSVAGAAEMFVESRAARVAGQRAGLPSPGVGLRHYSPRARLVLVDWMESGEIDSALAAEVGKYQDKKVGVMLPDGLHHHPDGFSFKEVYRWGIWRDPEQLARRLFAGLRELDARGCEVIVCPLPAGDGIAIAIRDRLSKAAWPGAVEDEAK